MHVIPGACGIRDRGILSAGLRPDLVRPDLMRPDLVRPDFGEMLVNTQKRESSIRDGPVLRRTHGARNP